MIFNVGMSSAIGAFINAGFQVITGALAVAILIALILYVHKKAQSKKALWIGLIAALYFIIVYLYEAIILNCGINLSVQGGGNMCGLFTALLTMPIIILSTYFLMIVPLSMLEAMLGLVGIPPNLVIGAFGGFVTVFVLASLIKIIYTKIKSKTD